MKQLGVIGLGTMGANLARNAARCGAEVILFNRSTSKTEEFMANHGSEGNFIPTKTLEEFLKALKPPRAVLLMIQAGSAIDSVITELLTSTTYHLQPNDILIDAGNSLFTDTERRERELGPKGIHFVGMGVSGGEEGALWGPSMMPGGDAAPLKTLMPLLQKMSADDGAGGKCVTHIGPGGAGHFVKMVHNGIEYGIMQLIAEAYDLLKSVGNMNNAELASLFDSWAKSEDLGSFLIEITAKIFTKKDDLTKADLLDMILDVAGQKGTGKWTTEAAMNVGIAIPTINAAVDARILSSQEDSRKDPGESLPEELLDTKVSREALIEAVRSGLSLSIQCAYGQGFEMIGKTAMAHGWDIHLNEIARIWRGGCIIRSQFLVGLQAAFDGDKKASDAILARFSEGRQRQWRQAIAWGVSSGIPLPAMSASLWFYDMLRRKRLPTNLIQAQGLKGARLAKCLLSR
jgi:6-phosphogluconate dehydrogenase